MEMNAVLQSLEKSLYKHIVIDNLKEGEAKAKPKKPLHNKSSRNIQYIQNRQKKLQLQVPLAGGGCTNHSLNQMMSSQQADLVFNRSRTSFKDSNHRYRHIVLPAETEKYNYVYESEELPKLAENQYFPKHSSRLDKKAILA